VRENYGKKEKESDGESGRERSLKPVPTSVLGPSTRGPETHFVWTFRNGLWLIHFTQSATPPAAARSKTFVAAASVALLTGASNSP